VLAPPAGTELGHVATDGTTILAGTDTGAVAVYRQDGGQWDLDGVLDVCGHWTRSFAVAGDVAVVGSGLNSDAGAVWIYRRGSGGWTPEAVLIDEEPYQPTFGSAVAIGGDRVFVAADGAYANDHYGQGAIVVFRRDAAAAAPPLACGETTPGP
jgi:hypothetical protein